MTALRNIQTLQQGTIALLNRLHSSPGEMAVHCWHVVADVINVIRRAPQTYLTTSLDQHVVDSMASTAPPCNERSCARQQTKVAWISYCFPPCLFHGMISFNISTSPLCGLRFGLDFPRLVDRGAEIFLYAEIGSVEGLIGLFQHRKASPRDVQYNTGYTALSVREPNAIGGQPSICLMLIGRDHARSTGRRQIAPRCRCRSLC